MTVQPIYFLLVDDLEENLLSLEALLRRDGLAFLKARSGPEALELLLKHDVALALFDVQMPGMDGFELAELMRGTERTRQVPIIFLTAGNEDRQRRFRGYEAGAVDFLHKPIEADILRSKASVFFELYRQKRLLATQRDELRQYTNALKEADQRKDEFIATLAHELRNPLAPIRNGLQILRMSPADDVAENVRAMMDRQLNHLVRLIDDLLDISRVSQGKIELCKENIKLQDAIHAAIEACQPLIEERQHRLTIDLPPSSVFIYGDLTRIAQMVSNILNNAAKYTPQNGDIHLSVEVKDEIASISVKDNGLGIPQEMLQRIFDIFTQVDHNLEYSQGGLGIGLSLVKRLAELHNGSIEASSEGKNKGSIFTIHLPVVAVDEVATPEVQSFIETPNASLQVLVVDDNIASAKTTGWMLEMIGCETRLAHDGSTALETARSMHPEVIVLDIGLPGMNGYDVCRELRKDPNFKETVMIAQTGWGQQRDRDEASAAGFDHHLIKPIDFEKFSALLADIKDNKQKHAI
jgi:signal transduction histidine kinase